MRIAVVGTGYVGLVAGACLADLGHVVTCLDIDAARILGLRSGIMPIFEPGIEDMVARNALAGRLAFTTDTMEAVDGVAAIFIAVGTPPKKSGHGADISAVLKATADIARAATGPVTIIVKSTVPPGTCERVWETAKAVLGNARFDVVSNPEFLREGSAIDDFMSPDRIVCGVESAAAQRTMQEIYAPLMAKGVPVQFVARRAAELTKHAANAFLALKISFANELADLCEALSADVEDVTSSVGLDRRIGQAFLRAGPGYGGSCFPKDTAALLETAREHGVNLRLVENAIAVNSARKAGIAKRIAAAMGGSVRGKTIGILGLTFKANTDDMREAPSLDVVNGLQRAGATIRAYDPQGMSHAREMLADVEFAEDAYGCAEGADCLVILTEWSEFGALNAQQLRKLMKGQLLVDLRNLMDRRKLAQAGFAVHSVGRSSIEPIVARAPRKRTAAPREAPDDRIMNGVSISAEQAVADPISLEPMAGG